MSQPLAFALVDESMAQLHGDASHFRSDSVQHIGPPADTCGASKKAERAFMQLAHFGQFNAKGPSPPWATFIIETRKENQNPSACGGTKPRRRQFPVNLAERDEEGGVVVALSKCSRLTLISGSPALSMIYRRPSSERSSLSRGFLLVLNRRGAVFIECAGEPDSGKSGVSSSFWEIRGNPVSVHHSGKSGGNPRGNPVSVHRSRGNPVSVHRSGKSGVSSS